MKNSNEKHNQFESTYHPTPAVSLKIITTSKPIQRFFEREFKESFHNPEMQHGIHEIKIIFRTSKPPNHLKKVTINRFIFFHYLMETDTQKTTVEIYICYPHILMWERVCPFYLSALITPLIYLESLKKGYLIVHSSAASMSEKAYVFPAEGGTGKTTLILSLVDHGMKFYGDDMVIISKNGMVYSYPRPFHLFKHHIKDFKKLHNISIKSMDKFRVYRNFVMTKILQPFFSEKLFFAVRARPQEYGFSISKPHNLVSLVFITRTSETKNIEASNEDDVNDILECILKGSDFNGYDWNTVLETGLQNESIFEMECDVLHEVLQKCKIVKIFNISHLKGKDSQFVFETISNICNISQDHRLH